MSFAGLEGAWAPYALLLLFGVLPSMVWKLMAAFVAHGIDEDSELLVWVRTIATTLLAGVACKLVFTPSGALAAAPLFLRFGALAAGLAAWRLAGRSVMAAVIVGEAAMVLGTWWWAR